MAAQIPGQSTKGPSERLAGRPMRSAATGARPRRWTTALVKCVVPIITASIGLGRRARALEQRPAPCGCRR
jgi:hypothetical protein